MHRWRKHVLYCDVIGQNSSCDASRCRSLASTVSRYDIVYVVTSRRVFQELRRTPVLDKGHALLFVWFFPSLYPPPAFSFLIGKFIFSIKGPSVCLISSDCWEHLWNLIWFLSWEWDGSNLVLFRNCTAIPRLFSAQSSRPLGALAVALKSFHSKILQGFPVLQHIELWLCSV